ncbi:hypothetical protein SAMN04487928_11166 [Butyrivibrio proteoclasticus]|uniref:Lipoprotein n=1 Tax=Butyrivibrio proteoclasticus TaxID=43305 RepID=A0A1I5U4V6_9FIRM|nr:hypothetical protein [Butyrivibrio proteoclasticus]SFP90279.1 hypothetical protein SAMN04487928_11166 [Butyrivibrio proteoclasticus]
MKKGKNKFNCIIASLALVFSLTGCLPGYNSADVLIVDAKAWVNGASYLITHEAFAFLYDIDHISIFNFLSKNPLLNVCRGKYFYKFKSHNLYVNNNDGKVYTDELLPYANSCFEDLFRNSLELSDSEKLVVDYDPNYEIQTTSYIRNNGSFSKKYSGSTDYYVKAFPAEYTKANVDNYIYSEYPYCGDIDECHIITDKSCENLQEIISLKEYATNFKDSESLMIYCPDGYMEVNVIGFGDDGDMDISAEIYKKESIVFDDKVKIEFFNEFSQHYSYVRSADDYELMESDYYSANRDFRVIFSSTDPEQICSIHVNGDEPYDIYLANAPYRRVQIKKALTNEAVYSEKCATKKYDDNWTKLVTSSLREKEIHEEGHLQSKMDTMFSNDGGYTLELYK